VARVSAVALPEIPVNSGISGPRFLKTLAGFGFQNGQKPPEDFYNSRLNFPKFFFVRNC